MPDLSNVILKIRNTYANYNKINVNVLLIFSLTVISPRNRESVLKVKELHIFLDIHKS